MMPLARGSKGRATLFFRNIWFALGLVAVGICAPNASAQTLSCDSPTRLLCGSSTVCTIHAQCLPVSAQSCAISRLCDRRRQCDFDPKTNKCVVGCQKSVECTELGKCKRRGRRCVASAEGCAASQLCIQSGLCKMANGRCVASDDGCQNSVVCQRFGVCQRKRDRCIPSDSGCNDSEVCINSGLCKAAKVAGVCQYNRSRRGVFCGRTCEAIAEGCKQATMCKTHGQCTLLNGRCVATSASCLEAERCRTHGFCDYNATLRLCRLSSRGCAQSELCGSEGRCSAAEGNQRQCVARTFRDCLESQNCLSQGYCGYDPGRDHCKEQSKEDAILARQNRERKGKLSCRKACRHEGRCHYDVDADVCLETAQGCAESQECKQFGTCVLANKKCVPSEAGCAASARCITEGLCHLAKATLKCVASAESCLEARVCRRQKRCIESSGMCVQKQSKAQRKTSSKKPEKRACKKNNVTRVVKRRARAFRMCYQREVKANPLLRGKLVVEWTIGLSGQVMDSRVVSNTLGEQRVADCVLSVVRLLRFQKPEGGDCSVQWPFNFGPGP